jgi:crotonobetainyl-CoA hydratase
MQSDLANDVTRMDFIRYEVRDRVCHVTINRPEVRNALNRRCHLELRRAFEAFRDDPDAWVAILTGTGSAFCAGQDLKEAATFAAAARDRGADRDEWPVWGGITQGLACPKPIIAAVNGFALGGGSELALACDLVVAAESARFGMPEVRRGIAASAGGVVRLPRQVPLKQAMAMLLTGAPISAARAHELGLVNEVVPDVELAEAANRWAAQILEASPLAVGLVKQAALGLLHLPVEVAMERQHEVLSPLLASADAAEGMRAFAERRPPVWVGR